jgi:hypothetical protein
MMRASLLSLVLLAACGTEPSSTSSALTREPGECSDIEVHVIGVSDGGDSSTVVLERPGKHILVLSSYASTDWNIDVRPGAKLVRVYAVGHNPQRVHANVATKIETESAMEGGPDVGGYAYPDKATSALLKLASIRVDRHATSFHGCFSATRWTIGENMAVSSDCAAGYTQYDAVTDCDGDNVCDGSGGGGSGSGSGSGGDGSLY